MARSKKSSTQTFHFLSGKNLDLKKLPESNDVDHETNTNEVQNLATPPWGPLLWHEEQ